MRKILLTLLALAIISFAWADEPSDWSEELVGALENHEDHADVPSEWSEEYVDVLKKDEDYADGKLNKDYQSFITRQDFAYIAVKVYEEITGETCELGRAHFKDSRNTYVLKAKNHKLVNGYDQDYFGPEDYVTREDLTVMLMNVLNQSGASYIKPGNFSFDDEGAFSSYAHDAIYTAYANKIINGVGDNKFNPKAFTTREEAIVMLVRMKRVFEESLIYKSNNRNYNWYIDQKYTGVYANENCGPSSAVMAALFQDSTFDISAADARKSNLRGGEWWYTSDISNFFDDHDIEYSVDGYDGYYELKEVVDQGDIALLCMNTSYISTNYKQDEQTGRFYSYSSGHFLIVKGYKKIDGEFYFEVYDPNNWGKTQTDGRPKGMDRYYSASELSESINNWWDFYFIIESKK